MENSDRIEKMKSASYERLSKFFSRGKTDRIKDIENTLSIVNVESRNASYVVLEGYYESRDIYDKCVASPMIQAASATKVSSSQYDKWQLDLKKYAQQFKPEETTYTLSDSTYIEGCFTCGTVGNVHCTNCNDGYETCYQCYGKGILTCNSCGGYGQVNCSTCGGSGSLQRVETVYVDDYPTQRTYYETCYTCGGYGRVDCGWCGGSGTVTCNVCKGHGDLVCSQCNGTTRVTCGSCSGYGHFLYSVCVNQKYDSNVGFGIIKDYVIDTTKYGSEKFAPLEFSKNDSVTYENISDSVLASSEHADLQELNKRLERDIKDCGDARYLCYRAREYEREVADVCYQIGGEEYNAIIDLVTGQIIMDSNPYESMAGILEKEVREYASTYQFKSLVEGYDDLTEIIKDDNVKYNIWDFSGIINGVERKITIFAMLIALIVNSFTLISKMAYHDTVSSVICILTCVPGVILINKLWKKFCFTDIPAIVLALVALSTGVVTFVLKTLLLNLYYMM